MEYDRTIPVWAGDPPGRDRDADLSALKTRAEAGLTRELAFTRAGVVVRLLSDAAGLYHGHRYVPAPGGGWEACRDQTGVPLAAALAWLSAVSREGGPAPVATPRAARRRRDDPPGATLSSNEDAL